MGIQKSELKEPEAEARLLYRKGMANLERGFCEDAYESLKKADSLNPGDKQIRQALQQASKGQKEDKVKAKQVWRDKLLSEEDRACQGAWWEPSVLAARTRA